MSLVTVKTFDNPMDAHLLRSKLESEGVHCFLFDENIVGLNPLYNVTVGGIKLKINEDDVDKVKVILAEIENTPHTDEEDVVISCPKCGSTNIDSGFKSMKGLKGILSAITSFILMVVPVYHNPVFKCRNCEEEFKN